MNNQKQIQIAQLTSVLLKSTADCCQLMHQKGEFFKVRTKDYNDPVTQIDFLIQILLVTQIRKIFEQIKIVGEQQISQISNNFDFLNPQHQTINIQLPHQLQDLGRCSYDDLCIWIDPLDCTRGFISNLKYQCTILIGVSYKGKPILGVIGQPYKRINQSQKYYYEPTVTIGCVRPLNNCSLEYWVNSQTWKTYIYQSTQKILKPKIAISSRRNNQKQQSLLKLLNAESVKTGGAGHKALMLVRGEIDGLFFIEVETSKWDSCAGEAIVKAMGGFAIQPNLKQIEYLEDSNYKNSVGFIFSKKGFISDCIKSYLQKEQSLSNLLQK